jgi:hypothetical protein
MMISTYTGPDEYPIAEVPDTRWWSENFASMYSCPEERVAVFYSIGRWHGDRSVWREVVMVSLPDQRVLHHRGFARAGTPTGPASALSRYEIVEPGETLRLSFDGPMMETGLQALIDHGALGEPTKRCTVDLQFDAKAPMWNMRGDSVEAGSMAGSMHIDHIGRCRGTIEYDGHQYRIADGYSARDHSRGDREISQYGGHNWINGQFPSGRSFYLYAMRRQGSTEIGMSNAAVVHDGAIHPAEIVHTEFAASYADIDKLHRVVLRSELGEMEVEIVTVYNTFVSSMVCPYDTLAGALHHRPSATLLDHSVLLRSDGEEGYGWAERGFTTGPLT